MRLARQSNGAGGGRTRGRPWRARALIHPAPATALPALKAAAFLSLGCAAAVLGPSARADGQADAAASAHARVVMMQRYIVSATRVDKNPWRYASLPGFEVLSRASADETYWELDALRRGLRLLNDVMPDDWRPPSPVPYTVIIDDTDLGTVPTSPIHSQPIVFQPPADALTWGHLSDRIDVSSDSVTAYDGDTFAISSNLHGVDTDRFAYGTIGLERLFRCAPPLPNWLIAGLLGQDSGVFRESFALFDDGALGGFPGFPAPWIRRAEGPGTLWVSLGETQRLLARLKKDKKAKLTMPPLRGLFGEAQPSDEDLPLWKSEAALFVRWGLMGPGRADPALSRAFLELVRRARQEPVTEQVFTDCFGFGYGVMEEKLAAFLKAVLARPTSVDLNMPANFENPELKPATADQIGRILGDWLRMQGQTLRTKDPDLSQKFLGSAGRVLLRAYRDDNGLPPDVDPSHGGERSALPGLNAGYGAPVVMKPFVVAASHIHDPRLLAVYGLYEHDLGNDGNAREFLEAAVKSGVVRPKAYLVLAKMRYAEAIGIPMGAEGKLTAQQAASVLEPLRTALQYPVDPEVYRLIVETWVQCEARPGESDIRGIVAGVALFPRNTGLAYRSAFLCARSGYAAEAAALIDKGLLFATRETNRDYFNELRRSLQGPPSSGAK